MKPLLISSVSQPLIRRPSYEFERRPRVHRNQERPASINLVFAIPLDKDIQALLNIHPPVPSRSTWTPSSESLRFYGDAGEEGFRAAFSDEYNSLAEQYGLRLAVAGETAFDPSQWVSIPCSLKHGWLYRIFRGTSGQSAPNRPDIASRALHKQSVSDWGFIMHSTKEVSRLVDIQDMVRLTRKSLLRLPLEYAPFPLILPTCIRATAHYIAQYANTKGLFRISGSERNVKSLLEYYYLNSSWNAVVSGTVCRSTLPTHIPYTIHDVASTFKRFLSFMPGGVLGSLTLFETFVEIHSKLGGPSEPSNTDRAKVRARFIALAIGRIESQFQRHMLCAVFGLLNMIGRIAELSPKEHCDGQSPPANHYLMDYSALGICFGPLLVGNPCEHNTMKPATSISALLPFSLSPRRHRRQMQKMAKEPKAGLSDVKNFMTAASVAEMLITHWRDVVQEMNNLNTPARRDLSSPRLNYSDMPSSISDPFVSSVLVDSDATTAADSGDRIDQDGSPEPRTATRASSRERSRQSSQASIRESSTLPTYSHLSPTLEEGSLEKACSNFFTLSAVDAQPAAMSDRKTTPPLCSLNRSGAIRRMGGTPLTHSRSYQEATGLPTEDTPDGFTQSMSMGAIPPRVSSRHTIHFGVSAMTPTFEAESKNTDDKQTPLVTVHEEHVEGPVRQADTPSLLDRLRKKGRAFKNLLTSSAEKLRYSMRPSNSFVSSSLPVESEDTISRPCRLLPPLFTEEDLTDDEEMSNAERRPRYLHFEGKTPTKRRSVRALAAMFEGQYDSSSLTGKTWTGTTPNGIAGWVEGSGQDKPMHFFIQGSPRKSLHSTKTLHSHPEMKDVAEEKNSPSLNIWSMAPQKDDAQHSFGNNNSEQRDKFSDVHEKGTQTTMIDDEATPQSVSSSTQYSWLDHLAVIESELVSCLNDPTTKAEDGSLLLDEKESARMILLEVQVQQMKEHDIPALRKQLLDANIDLNKWKERSLAAERKARLFQKFTTRVRRLHSSLVTESSRQSEDDESAIKEESDAEGSYLIHSVQFKKALEANKRGDRIVMHKKSRDVEVGDAVSKMSESLYPELSIREGSLYGDFKTTTTGNALLLHGMDGVASPKDDEGTRKFRNVSVELWMAVQELLQMEDEEALSPSQHSSSVCAENGSSSEYAYL
ncbi:hypothetical protein GGI43DRAFT_423922 [Trichoderma evansii]